MHITWLAEESCCPRLIVEQILSLPPEELSYLLYHQMMNGMPWHLSSCTSKFQKQWIISRWKLW